MLDDGTNRPFGDYNKNNEKSGVTRGTTMDNPTQGPTLGGSIPPGYGVIGNKYEKNASPSGGEQKSGMPDLAGSINESSPHAYGGTTHHPIKSNS